MLSETLRDVHIDIGSAVDTVDGIKAELKSGIQMQARLTPNGKQYGTWNRSM